MRKLVNEVRDQRIEFKFQNSEFNLLIYQFANLLIPEFFFTSGAFILNFFL